MGNKNKWIYKMLQSFRVFENQWIVKKIILQESFMIVW